MDNSFKFIIVLAKTKNSRSPIYLQIKTDTKQTSRTQETLSFPKRGDVRIDFASLNYYIVDEDITLPSVIYLGLNFI